MEEVKDGEDTKKRKPTVKDEKPIALTDVSYKGMMIGKNLKEHTRVSAIRLDEHVRFTKGREVLDNLLLLQESVIQAYRDGRELVVVLVAAAALDIRFCKERERRW